MSNATESIVSLQFPIPGPGLFKVKARDLDSVITRYATTPLSELEKIINDSGIMSEPVALNSHFEGMMIMAELSGFGL